MMNTQFQTTQFQTTQSRVTSDVIDFGVGHPSAALLPRALLQTAAAQRLGQPDVTLLQYGLEQGDEYFRHTLAGFLSRQYGTPVERSELFVSAGVSQALDLICTLYTQPGDVVFVEEPTYFLALHIFANHHLTVRAIDTDRHGLDIDALERALASQRPTLLYLVPTHQNPTGATLPQERRQRLVALSQRDNFLIVADEVYHLLSYTAAPPPPLATAAASGQVLALGSFSKILAPGLRLGWVQASPTHLQRLAGAGLLASGGGLNPFTSALVALLLEQGQQEQHLEELRQVYRRRIVALDRALQQQLGEQIRYTVPEGGYFFWLQLPDSLDSEQLLAQAARCKVAFRPGSRFSSRRALGNFLRLSFAFYEPESLQEGIHRLQRALAASC